MYTYNGTSNKDDVTYTEYNRTECGTGRDNLTTGGDFQGIGMYTAVERPGPFDLRMPYNQGVFVNTCKHACTAEGESCTGFTFNSVNKVCTLWHHNRFSTPENTTGCATGTDTAGDNIRAQKWRTYVKQRD